MIITKISVKLFCIHRSQFRFSQSQLGWTDNLPKSCITLRVHSLLAHQQTPDGLNKEASLTVHLEIMRNCCD